MSLMLEDACLSHLGVLEGVHRLRSASCGVVFLTGVFIAFEQLHCSLERFLVMMSAQ